MIVKKKKKLYISNRVSSIGRKIFNKKLKYLLSWFFFQRIKEGFFILNFSFFFSSQIYESNLFVFGFFSFSEIRYSNSGIFFLDSHKKSEGKTKKENTTVFFFNDFHVTFNFLKIDTEIDKSWKKLKNSRTIMDESTEKKNIQTCVVYLRGKCGKDQWKNKQRK